MEAVLKSDSAVGERADAVFMAKREAQALEKRLLVSPKHKNVNAALRRACFLLHALAQKYMNASPQAYNDYACLVQCTNTLQAMGMRPAVGSQLQDDADTSRDLVFNSFEYRYLRNKMLASLSIIADLTERNAGSGSADYRSGMREGYRRASDVAIMFLEDIAGGEH